MIDTKITDYAGLEHVIRNAEDFNRLAANLNERRDQLAQAMLGPDRGAAMAAERKSDRIEDVYLPKFQAETDRIRALLDTDASDELRRAKAQAIMDRPRTTGS